MTDSRLLLLAPDDNVLVARQSIDQGTILEIEGHTIALAVALGIGHKVARKPISSGEKVLKYGAPIGSATALIAVGEHVHIHNMQSDYTTTHVIERPDRAHS
ncbi:UxaA family hydrolase [Pelagibacterium lentulum]|uniref:Hydrolase n=1 Tax=Pelagibacterium lentulum TaxID=2029865 RepID=A0A916W1P7_9HYPH|nr:UxaA family hydrolase [Pelagibacterium lentulum]GGA59438.1 hydrolase [Pelagibacterium lentulum]